jgi:hypothetical protein
MLGYSPLLGSDLDNLLAIPYYPSPRGTEILRPLAMPVVGTAPVIAEHRQCSPEVAQKLGWRGSGRSLYSCLSVAGLCDTRRAPSHDQSG